MADPDWVSCTEDRAGTRTSPQWTTLETGDVITHAAPPPHTKFYVTGTHGEDRMRRSNHGQLLYGIVGNDIVGARNPDELHGGPCDDIVLERNGPHDFNGWMGDDVLHGGNGHDRA